MDIQVTGKHLDLGTALRAYVTERVENLLEKYHSRGTSAHILIEKEHGQFNTTCTVHLTSGLSLQGKGISGEAHASADESFEHLEKRLRRYRRRLKDHHKNASERSNAVGLSATDYVLHQRHEEEEPELTERLDLAPAIVAETQTAIHELSVSDAVMAMDLANKPFLIFKNAGHGHLNVVYRRDDGHIGWIDPSGTKAQ
ncbi:MAG: ribosome-associated translation inhibitor RaiA [Hyphomicrobiales bacterium]|nr:ribosome-associated translation inhibitor RaiA [Hyphomicrobiales bacterium]